MEESPDCFGNFEVSAEECRECSKATECNTKTLLGEFSIGQETMNVKDKDANEIYDMLERFNYDLLKKIFSSNRTHSAVIGAWIRWWLFDSNYEKEEFLTVLEPARMLQKGKSSDVMFLFKDSEDYYRVAGVAEVESDRKKLLDKIDTLYQYEQEYPDIVFSLLCATFSLYRRRKFGKQNGEYRDKVLKKMLEISKKSKLYWILFILKKPPGSIDPNEPYPRIRLLNPNTNEYKYEEVDFFLAEPDFYIIKDGQFLHPSKMDEF